METQISLIETEIEKYAIHYYYDGWMHGSVYPIIDMNDEILMYCSKEDGCPELNLVKARCIFEFSYCWRGIWEGRIYFKDNEYWSEELREMADLWDKIEEAFKAKIKEIEPQNHYDDN